MGRRAEFRYRYPHRYRWPTRLRIVRPGNRYR
jgi:hypothetical protein